MTPGTADHGPRPLTGILLMLFAVLSFTLLDSTAKYLSASLPIGQLLWGRYIFTLALTLAFLPRLGVRGLMWTARPVQQIMRGVTLLGTTGSLFLAVKFLPLAETYAITFISPFIVALVAGLLLGERVGSRRWLAILCGFLGVLVVIRPGSGVFSWHVIFPLAMAVLWAANQLQTRLLGATDAPLVTLFYTALTGTLCASILASLDWRSPGLAGWLGMAWMGVIGFLGQLAVIRAFASAPASLLSPLIYTQIIWASLIGYIAFSDMPDTPTIAGSAIITLSGLVLIKWRAQRSDSADASDGN